ncbi:predicted protein [Sclerotinia sclerotiorum 1980 UF-70]|uniref:Uncharacterized protein n=1 Tax=Sclerotinia sclerotiorum (strain ATCC 18683 / 1980 / Ss-1) TaxID=665079 RepID=A7E6J5_SCLS1|nr:predicted protein [Sclerotinia sclerotiorum 1980 UF-70]EDN91517.1 predicted protein [Sclerotinia sclerotiorum 1980 UF-70]
MSNCQRSYGIPGLCFRSAELFFEGNTFYGGSTKGSYLFDSNLLPDFEFKCSCPGKIE